MFLITLADMFYFAKNTLIAHLRKKQEIEISRDAKSVLHNINTANKSILIVEPNVYHTETLDSLIFYCKQLDFEVDLLLREEINDTNNLHNTTQVRHIFYASLSNLIASIRNTQDYDFVFFNTMVLDSTYLLNIAMPKAKYGFLGLIHTLQHIKKFHMQDNCDRFFALRENINTKFNIPTLSMSVPKSQYKPQNSNIITFISIGYLIYHKAFHWTLKSAVDALKKQGIDNIRFVLVGRNALSCIFDIHDNNIINMIVNPPTLDEVLEVYTPHFIFGLYDKFAHRHYLSGVTSGLRNLSLERNIPMLINEPFASSFGFNKTNAIIFNNNAYKAIFNAIQIANSPSYEHLKANLKTLNDTLISHSLHNLKSAITHQRK